MNLYESVKNSLKEATDGDLKKLRDELFYRIEDLDHDGEIKHKDISDIKHLSRIANKIKASGFFISNDIFTPDDDEYEWEQINMYLDNCIREYDKDDSNFNLTPEEKYVEYVYEWFNERHYWDELKNVTGRDSLDYIFDKSLKTQFDEVNAIYNDLYEENGINGELFVSYDEWLNNEYQELNEAEIITMDNDPAWKAAVEKVQKEYGLDKEMKKPYFNEKRDFLYAMYDKIKAGWEAIDWHSEMYFEMDMNVNALELIIMVEGDWKHDHAAIDSIADRTTQPVAKYEEVTEEDGSDWYSADHYFKYSTQQFKKWLDEEKPVKESEEPNSDREQKIKNVYLMDRIIRSMNNEEALYDSGWLYNVADEDSDGGFENFKELSLKYDSNDDYYYTDDEMYNHLVDLFKEIIKEYGPDGFMTKEYYQKHEGNWKDNVGLDDEQLAYLKTFISDPVLINEGEKMKSKKNLKESNLIKVSEHFKEVANELENIAEMYDEDVSNGEGDVFEGTEDEYASEMLDTNLGDIIWSDVVLKKLDDDIKINISSDLYDSIRGGNGVTYESLIKLLDKYGALEKLGIKAYTKELEKESETMKESGSWRWKDDIEDIEPTEENDDIWYAVAENMVENGDYKGYDVYEVMSNIINLFKISKDSMLYDYLLKWYGSEDKLRKNVRDIYETDDAIYFVTGSGYSLYDDDLLGGNGDGLTEKEFDKFIEEN